MSGLFSKPSVPDPPATPPPAPTMANTNTDVAAQQEALKLMRGRSATLLTGGAGVSTAPSQTSKVLLGS